MDKPKDYEYYRNSRNKIPYKEWPQEVKDYCNWQRRNRMNPKWKGLSDEERKKEKLKVIAQNRAKWHEKYNKMSEEEKAKVNKKKGNFWNNADEKTKEELRGKLKERSQNFWDSMTDEEKKAFGKYRWDLKSEEEKQEIIERFNSAGIEYMKSLPKEEMSKWVEMLNKARSEKMENDPDFRDKQISSLRSSCENYWSSLSDEDRYRVVRKRIVSANGENKLHRKFEKRFKSSFLHKEFNIINEQYICIGDMNKVWDYGIYSKDNNKLVMVVDLDGAFYHADICDYNGSHSQEEYDERRYQIVPPDVKIHIIYELNFDESFKAMVRTLALSYDKFIEEQFKICRSLIDVPYPSYSDAELFKSYDQLIKMDCDSKYINITTNTRIGDRLINHFHHSIYGAKRRSSKYSPFDAWYNDELLLKVIKNRMIYVNMLNPNKILQGFNISKIAQKVSVFSAGRAKLLIHKYLYNMNEIFDPFSGFSGRMLGTISLNKRYIGQDISEIHVRESNNILEFLKLIYKFDVYLEDKNILHSYGEYQSLFTCPPYSDKEQWLEVPIDKRTCDDWITECLSRFKCKKYLFVVDNTEKYKKYIVDDIINKSHFGSNKEYVILIEGS